MGGTLTATIERLNAILEQMGSDVLYHREGATTPCPCRTPEGFRDPAWHRANPAAPVCNEQGYLDVPVEFTIKASVQPFRQRGNRGAQREDLLLGEVQADDRIGIFPVTWEDNTLDFSDWSDAGEDFIVYDNNRYLAVAADKIPDIDGDPNHHWEVGLRLIKSERP